MLIDVVLHVITLVIAWWLHSGFKKLKFQLALQRSSSEILPHNHWYMVEIYIQLGFV